MKPTSAKVKPSAPATFGEDGAMLKTGISPAARPAQRENPTATSPTWLEAGHACLASSCSEHCWHREQVDRHPGGQRRFDVLRVAFGDFLPKRPRVPQARFLLRLAEGFPIEARTSP